MFKFVDRCGAAPATILSRDSLRVRVDGVCDQCVPTFARVLRLHTKCIPDSAEVLHLSRNPCGSAAPVMQTRSLRIRANGPGAEPISDP